VFKGTQKKRDSKDVRKKGQPKWKNVTAEIAVIEKRLAAETPPSGSLYYKYKAEDEKSTKTNENI
jgi:hypothetical protein